MYMTRQSAHGQRHTWDVVEDYGMSWNFGNVKFVEVVVE
jgi:hypothetical protein